MQNYKTHSRGDMVILHYLKAVALKLSYIMVFSKMSTGKCKKPLYFKTSKKINAIKLICFIRIDLIDKEI